MIEFLNNPWVVGIFGGIISSIAVYLITIRFQSKRENREYQQKIIMANNDLLYSIRPLIIGQKTPNEDMLDAIIQATSRKHNVHFLDLYDYGEIAEDLTKEILDNSFLNTDEKIRYCEITNTLRNLMYENAEEEVKEPENKIIITRRISDKVFVSSTFAIMTGLTTLLVAVITQSLDLPDHTFLFILSLPTFFLITSAYIGNVLMKFTRNFKNDIKRLYERLEEQDKIEDSNKMSAK